MSRLLCAQLCGGLWAGHEDRLDGGMIAQPAFARLVQVAALHGTKSLGGEDVVEAAADAPPASAPVPAELLRAVAVQRPEHVGEVVRGQPDQHVPFSVIPALAAAPVPTAPECYDPTLPVVLAPGHHLTLGGF